MGLQRIRLIALLLALLPSVAIVGGCASATGLSFIPVASEMPALAQEFAMRPSDTGVALRLGAGYRAAGLLPEAAVVLESVRTIDPGDDAAALFLGLTYEDMGRLVEARTVYEDYLDSGASGLLTSEIEARVEIVRKQELRATIAASLRGESILASTVPEPNTIAVFPFVYQGSDDRLQPLGRAFAAMLVTDLSKTDRLTVLERTDVDMLLEEAALVAADRVEVSTAARGGMLLGAASVVQGLLGGRGDRASPITLEGAVVEVAEGPVRETSLSDETRIEGVFTMEKRVAFSVYESLGIQLTPAEREHINRRATDNLQALLAFGLGLEAEAVRAFDQAARHFREAVVMDPRFAEARAAAARSDQAQRSAVSTEAVASRAAAELEQASGFESYFDLHAMLEGVEGLVPTGEERDGLEEVGTFDVEDVGSGLRITVRRPGGGP